MRAVGVNLGSAVFFQGFGRVAQGAGGVDHVVYQDAGAPFDVADDVHHLGVVSLLAALVDDTQVDAQGLGDGTCAHDTTDVRGDDHQVLETLVFDIVDQYGRAVDVVDRDIEETLDLVSVQVDGENTVDTYDSEHVSDDFGADGYTCRTRTAVLAGVSEVRNHGGDSGC
ncbi:hypothetical protein D3C78_1295790 [compost metagenome]